MARVGSALLSDSLFSKPARCGAAAARMPELTDQKGKARNELGGKKRSH